MKNGKRTICCAAAKCPWLLAVCIALILPRTSFAEIHKLDPARSTLLATGLLVDIPSLTFSVGNLIYAVEGERPSSVWIRGGYICGALSVLSGIGMLSLYAANPSGDQFDNVMIGVGIGQLAIGIIGIGFTIWATSRPDRRPYRITFAPMVMPDARGNAAPGVGLRVAGW